MDILTPSQDRPHPPDSRHPGARPPGQLRCSQALLAPAVGTLYSPHPYGSPFGQHPLQTSAVLPMFPRFAGEGNRVGDQSLTIWPPQVSIAVRDELLAITALDALEQQHLSDALAWAESGAPLCRVEKPATPPKHLVSYFVLVDADEILLVDHKQAGLWLPSGGHVEPGEDPRQTVVREIKEELALDVAAAEIGAPLMVTCTQTVGSTLPHVDVSLWYIVRGDRRVPVEFERAEFHAVRWFAFDEVPFHRCDPHLRRFLDKLQSARAAGLR